MSLFKLGLIVTIIGITWTGFEFATSDKISESFDTKAGMTRTVSIQLDGKDTGFYDVTVPELGDYVFVRVTDSESNVVADKRIETKRAVNYFDFEDDYYTLQITNLTERDFEVNIVFGSTNAQQMKYSGMMVLGGMILVVVAAYKKLHMISYNMAQPDENI